MEHNRETSVDASTVKHGASKVKLTSQAGCQTDSHYQPGVKLYLSIAPLIVCLFVKHLIIAKSHNWREAGIINHYEPLCVQLLLC